MQFGGFNYLMPVDVTLHDEADLRRLPRVGEIVADLKQAKNLRILVLDACRDNPLADELSGSMVASRGLTVDPESARLPGVQFISSISRECSHYQPKFRRNQK